MNAHALLFTHFSVAKVGVNDPPRKSIRTNPTKTVFQTRFGTFLASIFAIFHCVVHSIRHLLFSTLTHFKTTSAMQILYQPQLKDFLPFSKFFLSLKVGIWPNF